MDQTDTEATSTGDALDPVKSTRERLAEIGEVWVEFAKHRAEVYRDKLPDALKQYLKPKAAADAEAPGRESAESGAT